MVAGPYYCHLWIFSNQQGGWRYGLKSSCAVIVYKWTNEIRHFSDLPEITFSSEISVNSCVLYIFCEPPNSFRNFHSPTDEAVGIK